MRSRGPVPIPSRGEIAEWANRLVGYLRGLEVDLEQPSPKVIQLEDKTDSASAAQHGLLMFDPALGVPVFSWGGSWHNAAAEAIQNSNGFAAKYDDGVLICSHQINLGSRLAFGNGTYADPYRTDIVNWVFPEPFIAAPSVSALTLVNAGSGVIRAHAAYCQAITALQATNVQAMSLTSNNTASDITVSVHAFGRWK